MAKHCKNSSLFSSRPTANDLASLVARLCIHVSQDGDFKHILTDSDLFYPINGHEGALDSRNFWVGACRYDPHGPLAFTRPVWLQFATLFQTKHQQSLPYSKLTMNQKLITPLINYPWKRLCQFKSSNFHSQDQAKLLNNRYPPSMALINITS